MKKKRQRVRQKNKKGTQREPLVFENKEAEERACRRNTEGESKGSSEKEFNSKKKEKQGSSLRGTPGGEIGDF